ncbi:MAG: MobA/MobL family protein [Methylobacterium sp.]|nr:MobA/MobL family protein [Methylobacterium sp.]
MAIYSLHHSTIGKTTQAHAYTASAHVDYIMRASALTRVEGARMPADAGQAMAFLKQGEDRDRKNARIIDKVLLALPRELNSEQRAALVRAFAEQVTKGQASWLAAFHEGGKDAQNPHVHLVIRDRDENGRRVARLSEKGSTERLRVLWEQEANAALTRARRPERIDRRTLQAQGIRRKPTIHEGVRARRLDGKRMKAISRTRTVKNSAFAHSRFRAVDYQRVDGGIARVIANSTIKRGNVAMEKAYWQELDELSRDKELARLRAIHLSEPDRVRDEPDRDL